MWSKILFIDIDIDIFHAYFMFLKIIIRLHRSFDPKGYQPLDIYILISTPSSMISTLQQIFNCGYLLKKKVNYHRFLVLSIIFKLKYVKM